MSDATVAISFEYGPDPEWTPRVLAALSAAQVRATFFFDPSRATVWPELVHETTSSGHEVGIHIGLPAGSEREREGEVRRRTFAGVDILASLGACPSLWLPRSGGLTQIRKAVAEESGLEIAAGGIPLDVWTPDLPHLMLNHIGDRLKPGVFLRLFDGMGAEDADDSAIRGSLVLIPMLAARVTELGFKLVPVSERGSVVIDLRDSSNESLLPS